MSLSRIYQGKVASLEVLALVPQPVLTGADLATLQSPLFLHHQGFQDAVNYYHLCLAALAGDDAERPLYKLKQQMSAAWDGCQPEATEGWRARVAEWMDISAKASFAEVIRHLVEGSEGGSEAKVLAGELLLDRIEGDIQQAGRGYWPRFCDPKANPTWDFSTTARASASGLARLAGALHAEQVSEEELRAVAAEMDLSWTVKLQPGKNFTGAEARARLTEAAGHFLKLMAEPPAKLAEVLQKFPAGAEEWQGITARIAALPDTLEVPRNRKASPDLTFATLLFQHFPSPFTAAVLSLSVGKAKKAVAKKVVMKSARKKDNAVTKAAVVEKVTFDFAALGDDPIKLARGARGFVFPAFTSLSRWAVAGPGQPLWKEYDIAAFKEALKTVNQFKLKTEERNALLREAIRRLSYMDEVDPVWQSGPDEEVGHKPSRLKSDPKFALLKKLLAENRIANKATGEQWVDRGIYSGSLRGYKAIRKDWQEAAEKHKAALTEQHLTDIVKEYQRDHSFDIGDVNLFLTLCGMEYWPLWKPLTEDEETERGRDGRAKDMIAAYREWVEVNEDKTRLAEPIRFTPAHARTSRRLYMFSDITGKQGAEFTSGGNAVEVSIAYEWEGKLRPVRAKIGFAAPRVARDEISDLSGGTESMRWLQPMMKALGCPEPEMPALEKCAVSLMPDVRTFLAGEKGKEIEVSTVRLLLNFPTTLDPEKLIGHLGKQALWYRQFNGTYNSRAKTLETGLHLYWPGMENAPEADDKTAWWNHKRVEENGFSCLSVDLGQRDAGAWALLETRWGGAFTKRKERLLELGKAGGRNWSAALIAAGMFRLPGEDAKTKELDEKGKRKSEFYGSAGRNAAKEEWDEAKIIAATLGGEEGKARLGETHEELSHVEQNGELLRIISRAQSRLSRLHRWSCRVKDRTESIVDEILGYGVIDAKLTAAVTAADARLRKFAAKHKVSDKDEKGNNLTLVKLSKALTKAGTKEESLKELLTDDVEGILKQIIALFDALRPTIEKSLVRVANRELTLRKRDWIWQRRTPVGDDWQLIQGGRDEDKGKVKLQGQRGLSFARIEQVDTLRKRFMSLNRAMALKPEIEAQQGVEDRNRRLPEPCQDILDKLDRLKEQRVNQTAHLILAQALGLRLRAHEIDRKERRAKDIHGEYEAIPGRKPVDFIVMEDLSRYLSSQGRAPSENRRLMKWSHRAVLDKLKQMTEPFGIPVLEVAAAYSSRFCALTGVPGFRADEVHDEHAKEFRWARVLKKAEGKDKLPADVEDVWTLFDQLKTWNEKAREKRKQDRQAKAPLRTLLVPRAGGPIFVPMKGRGPCQADINAAINLGLRAIASPTCLRARPKIRCQLVEGKHVPVQGNKMEKAAAISLTPPSKPSKELAQLERTNYFVDLFRVAKFDSGEAVAGTTKVKVAGGMAFWKQIKEGQWERVKELNDARIAEWKRKAEGKPAKETREDDDDRLPGL